MIKINSKKFNFGFFLSDNVKVKSLENGAIAHGGATKYDNGIYANIEGSDFIEVKQGDNEISLFIPSTIDADTKINNEKITEKYVDSIKRFYTSEKIRFYSTTGSWYSEDLKKVIVEGITIVTVNIDTITESDINIFIELAKKVKTEMNQEGVSIAINKALAIV